MTFSQGLPMFFQGVFGSPVTGQASDMGQLKPWALRHGLGKRKPFAQDRPARNTITSRL